MLVVNNRNIPMCLEELTWIDYRFLVESENLTSEVMIAHFLGISVELLREMPITEVPYFDIRNALSFVNETELARLKDIQFTMPTFEGIKTGQVLQAFDVLASEKNMLAATEKIVAIFFHGNIDKLGVVKTLPAYKVIGLGNFFLASLKTLNPNSGQSIQSVRQAKKKFWQMAVKWLNSIFSR
jgi:hypothetical protein